MANYAGLKGGAKAAKGINGKRQLFSNPLQAKANATRAAQRRRSRPFKAFSGEF